ncbi:hypothetical protein DAPPUDRAFT_248397 [Daphnia pulex]|uniref:Uncharacterized protein n=1 Tax=Daphnia pulex TaxID=6669 RepID=E9GUK8_DAPPU|nr:hypothetical protein DAPPUDRAFT_248397 [Daphnia pulex]|eukprot:EFX76744.1 hypothetical protein DAPPUDRAFT_248397 [Daphnia pulex]
MNRRARIMARFQQNHRLLLDVDSEFEDSEDEDNLVDGESANRDPEVPIQLYPEVNHEGHCPLASAPEKIPSSAMDQNYRILVPPLICL